jgi:hypothetical protein
LQLTLIAARNIARQAGILSQTDKVLIIYPFAVLGTPYGGSKKQKKSPFIEGRSMNYPNQSQESQALSSLPSSIRAFYLIAYCRGDSPQKTYSSQYAAKHNLCQGAGEVIESPLILDAGYLTRIESQASRNEDLGDST